jgi:predicted nucleotidyltransferase
VVVEAVSAAAASAAAAPGEGFDMAKKEPRSMQVLERMVRDLESALGEKLVSVVLYGSAARGDFEEGTSDFNLLLVLSDLSPSTLEALTKPVRSWERQGQPSPRYFTRETLADAADVFPIEFLDIKQCRIVKSGEDPFERLEIHRDHLRLQCERELREKMMRLRERYIECNARPKELRRLLTDSYTTFAAIFRGCLHLTTAGEEPPVHNDEVVSAFCSRAGLDPAPFDEVDRLKRSGSIRVDPKSIFTRYYEELSKAVGAVDRFETDK